MVRVQLDEHASDIGQAKGGLLDRGRAAFRRDRGEHLRDSGSPILVIGSAPERDEGDGERPGTAGGCVREIGLGKGRTVGVGRLGLGHPEISPILVQEMTRLAAAALLETFPNTAITAAYIPGPGRVPPATVRRAAAFIEAHADQPVTVTEIAAAAGVTARALQYTFPRHYGTNLTGYLRRVRLERAHRQLQAADPTTGTTVAEIARRWGWASPASFATAYRKQYGLPPATRCAPEPPAAATPAAATPYRHRVDRPILTTAHQAAPSHTASGSSRPSRP